MRPERRYPGRALVVGASAFSSPTGFLLDLSWMIGGVLTAAVSRFPRPASTQRSVI
ncbi:MAG TPA: hypothetical protein VF792_12750 [Ktedonobacterales bacterium]